MTQDFNKALQDAFAASTASDTANPVLPSPAPSSQKIPVGADFNSALAQAFAANTEKPKSPPQVNSPINDNLSIFENFYGGTLSGVRALGTLATGVGAIATDSVGLDSTRDSLIQRVLDRQQAAARKNEPYTSYQDMKDAGGFWGSPEKFAEWLSFAVGEQIPNIASIIAGGGIGALLGKSVAKGYITREAAQAAGAYAVATGIETGATASEQIGSIGEVNPKVALAAGLAKGALESITPLALGKTAGILGTTSDDLIKSLTSTAGKATGRAGRIVYTAGKAGLLEAGTEITQEAVDIVARSYVDKNYSWASPDVKDRLVESAITALATGGLLGGVAGAFTPGPTPGITDAAGQKPAIVPGGSGPVEVNTTNTEDLSPIVGDSSSLYSLLKTNNPDLTPKSTTDESVLGSIAVLSKSDVMNEQELIEFSPESKAFYTSITKGSGDVSDQVFLKATPEILKGDVTVPLSNLPQIILDSDKNVSFTDPATSAEALAIAQEASYTANIGETSKAEGLYKQAIDKGFRYKPSGEAGFILVRPKSGENLLVSQAPRAPESAGLVLLEGKAVQLTPDNIPSNPNQLSRNGKINFILPDERTAGSLSIDNLTTYMLMLPGYTTNTVERLKAVDSESPVSFTIPEDGSLEKLASILESGTAQEAADQGYALRAKGYNNYLVAKGSTFQTYASPSHLASMMKENDLEYTGVLDDTSFAEAIAYAGGSKAQEEKAKGFTSRTPKAGTVDTVDITSGKSPDLAKEVTGLIAKLYKRFLPNHSLGLVLYNAERDSKGRKRHNGFAYRTQSSEGKHTRSLIGIAIPQGATTVEARASVFSTVVHEVGHILTEEHLTSEAAVTSGLTRAALEAYHRWRNQQDLMTPRETGASGYSPSRLITTTPSNVDDLATSGKVEDYGTRYTSYVQSFPEFLADQFVLYTTNENTSWSKTDSFLINLKKKLQRLLTVAKKLYPADIKLKETPEEFFQSFFTYLSEGQSGATLLASIEKSLTGRRSWNKALGIYVDDTANSTTKDLVASLHHSLPAPLLHSKEPNGKTVSTNLKDMQQASDYFTSVVKWGWNVLQLAWRNPHIKHLQEYVDKADQWQTEKNNWQSLANETVKNWKALGKDQADRVSRALLALDMRDTHPTPQERQALYNEHGITTGGAVVIDSVQKDFNAMLDRLEELALLQLQRNTKPDTVARLLSELEIQKEFKALRDKPYFPHARFGDWSVIVTEKKTGKTVHMEQVETNLAGAITSWGTRTPREVLSLESYLKKQYASATHEVAIARVPEEVQVFQGMPPAILNRIKAELYSSLSDVQREWLDKLSIEFAPTQSFRKRLQRRANIAGYSQNAMRSYANYFWHGSNHLARISYGRDMENIITDFKKDNSQRIRQGVNISSRVRMVDFLEDHLKTILNPKPDWAQLRSIAFTWWLGFSPASAVLNFTQLPLVTLPYLSARFGDVATMGAMRRASLQLRKSYMNPEKMSQHWTPENAALIERGLQQGFLEESLAMELAGVAEGNNLVRARQGSALQRGMSGFAHAAGWMFQASEKMNRRITFLAASDLARKNPDSKYLAELKRSMSSEYQSLIADGFSSIEAGAFLAGKDAVRRTQFEYGSWARPRFMRGKRGVIFTFYMFLQNMLWTVGNSPGNKRILLSLLLMGGLMGLPGAEDMETLVEYIGKKLFGKRFKASEEIAKMVVELTDSNRMADLALHGGAREGFGLPILGDMVGLPIPQFDMSGSVGMGQIVPGIQALSKDGGSFEEALGSAATDVAGASLGIGINMMKFLTDSQLPITDMKRWERAMPRAMKNVARSMRYVPPDSSVAALTGNFVMPEGRERSRTGSTIIAFDGDNPEQMMEIAMQAAGFNPTRLSREWNEIIAKSEALNYWKLRKTMLLTQYWHTLYTKDPDARKDTLASIRSYNKQVPYPEMGINNKILTASMKARKTAMLKREKGIAPGKAYQRYSDSIGELYPSEDDTVVERTEVK